MSFSLRGTVFPLLTPDIREELFPYLGGVLRNLGCPGLQVGSVEDHVHVLLRLSRTISLADLVKSVKTSTSIWIKTRGPAEFACQAGYGAFSVGQNQADVVIRYIQNQEDHHRLTNFQDELRKLITEAGIAFDERYVWD
jgi:REP element-mobilizing transposase RayT